jgi:hypothetical protein
VKFHEDVRSLIKDMVRLKAHKISPQGNFVPAPPKTSKKTSANSLPVTAELRSAIFDVIVEGAQEWQGKFHEYIKNTTWDPRHGYSLVKEATASSGHTTNYRNGI